MYPKLQLGYIRCIIFVGNGLTNQNDICSSKTGMTSVFTLSAVAVWTFCGVFAPWFNYKQRANCLLQKLTFSDHSKRNATPSEQTDVNIRYDVAMTFYIQLRSEMYKIEFCSATYVCVWVFITGTRRQIPSIPVILAGLPVSVSSLGLLCFHFSRRSSSPQTFHLGSCYSFPLVVQKLAVNQLFSSLLFLIMKCRMY